MVHVLPDLWVFYFDSSIHAVREPKLDGFVPGAHSSANRSSEVAAVLVDVANCCEVDCCRLQVFAINRFGNLNTTALITIVSLVSGPFKLVSDLRYLLVLQPCIYIYTILPYR